MINKVTLITLLLISSLLAQTKETSSSAPEAIVSTAVKPLDKVKIDASATDIKANSEADIEVNIADTEDAGSEFIIDYKITKEMLILVDSRNKTIDNLTTADAKMNTLIMQSQTWDLERNKNKKGQFDTIIDKAERLAVSNEFRAKISIQAKIISQSIMELAVNRKMIAEQTIEDEKRIRMNAHEAVIKKLEQAMRNLKNEIKMLESQKDTTTNNVVKREEMKKNLKVAKYLKIKDKTTLRDIAFAELYNEDKWQLIFDHPENKALLKEKSPTAILPIGIELAIPLLEEEE